MNLEIGRENTRTAGLVRDKLKAAQWRLPTEEEKQELFAPWKLRNPGDPNDSAILDAGNDWIAQSDNSEELIARFNMLSRELQRVIASSK